MDSQHWAYTSGGAGGASIPSMNDVVYIDNNSFDIPGKIQLSSDIHVKSLLWQDAAKESGFYGDFRVTCDGLLYLGSVENNWNGTFILNSSKVTFASFGNTIYSNDFIFTSNAQYNVISPLKTTGAVRVLGDGVNFNRREVKANPLQVSDIVKGTIKRSFFKASQGANGFFEITLDVKGTTCIGDADGSAEVTLVKNGKPPYTYVWQQNGTELPETSSKLQNLAAGVYIISIYDSGTPQVSDYLSFTIYAPKQMEYRNFKITDNTCNGGNTGSISFTPSGGNGGNQYSVDNGTVFGTNTVLTGLSAGEYNLKIKDAKGCVYTYPRNPIMVDQASAIVLTANKTDITGCFGNSNGTITVTGTGGAGALEYSIDGVNFSTNTTFNFLAAGNYTITARSSVDHSCVKTTSVTISQPAKLNAAVTANPVTGCSATPDGQIIITGSTGGSGEYEYSIDGGLTWATTSTFSGLNAGSYNVLIRDRLNPTCNAILNAALTIIAHPPLTATVTSTNVTCNGNGNGTITITNPQGGSNAYEYSIITGNWVSNGTFTNLLPNTYTVQIRDKNNIACSKILQTVTISEPATLSGSVSHTNVTGCFDANNGSITISAPQGGSGQYEYSINTTNWYPTSSFTNLTPGVYTVSMRDKVTPACFKVLGTITIIAPDRITSTSTKVDVTGCAGNANGVIRFINTLGGSGQYEFSIDNGISWSANSEFLNISAGNYTLLIRDKLTPTCISNIGLLNIKEPVAMMANVATTDVACFGTSTGQINITNPIGGTGLYEFSIDGGVTWQVSPTFQNLPAAIYQVSMRDAGNKTCTRALGAFTIGQSAKLTATVKSTNVTGCNGTANGSIAITNPTGGSGNYEYSLDGTTWVTTATFANLAARTYPVFIRDVANTTCSVKLGDYDISQPANINIADIRITDPLCFNSNSGSITITATGGTAPLTYSIGGAFQSPNLFTNLNAGDYQIIVRDAAGCSKRADITLANPAKIVPAVTHKDISCTGGNTGQIDITSVTGGVAPYQYSILAGGTGTYRPTSLFIDLASGAYNVKVKDANGCESDIIPVTIKAAIILDVVVGGTSPVKPCAGGTSGSITLDIKSGTPPYQYNIGKGNTSLTGSTITGLAAGAYPLTITDATGCIKDLGVVNIAEPALLTATATATNVTGCFDSNNGSIFITAGGGVAPYSYSVDNGISYVTTNNIQNLRVGNYAVKVKDANGCEASAGNIAITAPNKLTIDLAKTTITNVDCNGSATGSITIVATGGVVPFQYSLGTGTPQAGNSFNNLGAGSYVIKVTDAGGCTQSAPVDITQPNPINVNAKGINISCSGNSDGKILVTPTGGTPAYTVTLNPVAAFNNGAFSNLAPNTYAVTVTDGKGCVANTDITLTAPQPIAILNSTSTNPTCAAGGSISVTATGGTAPLKYSLLSGATAIATNETGNFTNVGGGTYKVSVSDINNCSPAVTSDITLTSPTTIVIDNIIAPAIGCNGSKSTISARISGVVAVPIVSLQKDGADIPHTVTPVGADYSVNAVDLSGGSYILRVSTAADPTCFQTQTIVISEPTKLVLSIPTIVSPGTGNNGSIAISAAGGTPPYSYRITPSNTVNNTGIFNGLAAGTYTVTVTDANTCTATYANISLSNLAATVTPSNVKCFGASNGELIVDMQGGSAPYSIRVTYPDNSVKTFTSPAIQYVINGLASGTYSVVVTDANGTSVTKTATLTEPTKLAISLQNGTVVLCHGDNSGKIDVVANGGTAPYTITWGGVATGTPSSSGTLVGQSISGLSPDQYTVNVVDNNGCTVSANHTISANPEVTFTVSPISPSCGMPTTGSISVSPTGGSGGYSYANDGVTFNNTSGKFTGLSAGTYFVAVKDKLGCTSITENVVLNAASTINIVSTDKTDTQCAQGGSIEVVATGGNGNLSYTLIKQGAGIQATNMTGLFSDLLVGSYNVSVSDGGTCPVKTPLITINNGGGVSTIKADTITVTSGKCFGEKGSVRVYLSGVVGNINIAIVNKTSGVTLTEGVDYTLSISPGRDPNAFVVLATEIVAGTYNMFISDNNACPQKVPFGFKEVAVALQFDSVTSTDPASNTLADGTITAVVSGGRAPYTYTLEGTTTSNNDGRFTGLNPGTYRVVVEDAYHCIIISQEVVLTAQSNLSIDDVYVKNPTCTDQTNGSLEIIVSGNNGAVRYSIDNGVTFQDVSLFENLAAGVYDVVVEDAVGARATVQVTIINPTPVELTISKITTPSSDGKYKGSIEVVATGGSGLYNYILINETTGVEVSNVTAGSVQIRFDNLPTGVYTIKAVDENGCEAIVGPINLEELSVVGIATDATCNKNDGSIAITIKGGQPPFKVALTRPDGTIDTPIDLTDRNHIFTNLAVGTYVIAVTDATNSVATAKVTVKDPGEIALTVKSVTTDILCANDKTGQIVLGIKGGKPAYTIDCKNALGEVAGTVDLTTFTITGLGASTYTIIVTDANGCKSPEVAATINGYTELKLSAKVDSATCAGHDGRITVTATDGVGVFEFRLTPGDVINTTGVFENLAPGKYVVAATNKCETKNLDVVLSTKTPIRIKVTNKLDTLCFGETTGSIILAASGGQEPYQYQLTTPKGDVLLQGTPDFNGLSAGAHLVMVTDNNGCVGDTTVTIESWPELNLVKDDAASNLYLWCRSKPEESRIKVDVTGGTAPYTITYADQVLDNVATATFDNIPFGRFTVEVRDAHGCTAAHADEVTARRLEAVLNLDHSACKNYVVPEKAKEFGGTATFQSVVGDYSDKAKYYFKPATPNTEVVQDNPFFETDTKYYLWHAGDRFVNLSGKKYIYNLQVRDSVIVNGEKIQKTCVVDDEFTIGVKPENDFTVAAFPENDTVCINTTVDYYFTLALNPAFNKNNLFASWDGGEAAVLPATGIEQGLPIEGETMRFNKVLTSANPVGKHIAMVTIDAEGEKNLCYDSDTAFAMAYASNLKFTSSVTPIPFKDKPGYFIRVPYTGQPEITLEYNSEIKNPIVVWEPVTAEWFDFVGLDLKTIKINQNFNSKSDLRVTLSYPIRNGAAVCTDTTGLVILPLSSINPPNAFTPNGDGYNDTWRVLYDTELGEFPNLEVEIFNRWGSLVFHAKPYKNDWNGRNNGTELPTGTYYYVIKPNKGNLPNVSGAVSILR